MEKIKNKLLTDNIVVEFDGTLNGNSLHTKVEMFLKEPLQYGSKEHSKNVSDIFKLFNNINIENGSKENS